MRTPESVETYEALELPGILDHLRLDLLEAMIHQPLGLVCFVLVLGLIAKSYFSRKPISIALALATSAPLLFYAFFALHAVYMLWQLRFAPSKIEGLFHPEVVILDTISFLLIGIGQTVILITAILIVNLFIKRSMKKGRIYGPQTSDGDQQGPKANHSASQSIAKDG